MKKYEWTVSGVSKRDGAAFKLQMNAFTVHEVVGLIDELNFEAQSIIQGKEVPNDMVIEKVPIEKYIAKCNARQAKVIKKS